MGLNIAENGKGACLAPALITGHTVCPGKPAGPQVAATQAFQRAVAIPPAASDRTRRLGMRRDLRSSITAAPRCPARYTTEISGRLSPILRHRLTAILLRCRE